VSLASFIGLATIILALFGLLCTGLGLYVRLMFRGELGALQNRLHAELGEFKDGLRRELRDGYLDAKLAAAQMRPLEVGLAKTTERIDEVERYAHLSRHDWANQLMGLQRDVQVLEGRLDKLETGHVTRAL